MQSATVTSDFLRDQILARSNPAAATPTDLYAVPAGGNAHILGVMLCNVSGGAEAARISISPAGALTATQDFLYFDLPVAANDTFLCEIDTTLGARDTVRVQSASGNLVFTLFGIIA